MTFTKEESIKITQLLDDIDNRKAHVYANNTYKDNAALKEIGNLVSKLFEEDDIDKDTLYSVINLFRYLGECYESMGRYSVAANYYFQTLKATRKLKDNFGESDDETISDIFNAIKTRNVYVDDDCLDVKKLVNGLVAKSVIEHIFDRALHPRRQVKLDKVEMTEEYLNVIDVVEERIDDYQKINGRGSSFQKWELKRKYLKELGIDWISPANLNPDIKFD